MNVDNLFAKNIPLINEELDDKILNLMLNQLLILSIEDKEEEFDNLLKKVPTVLKGFAIRPEITVESGYNDNEYIASESDDYSSFLLASINLMNEKYSVKIVKKAGEENKDRFIENEVKQKCIYLISQSFRLNKRQVLKELINSGFANESSVLQTILIYQRTYLKDCVNVDVFKDMGLMHQVLLKLDGREYKSIFGLEDKKTLRLGSDSALFTQRSNGAYLVKIMNCLKEYNWENYSLKEEVGAILVKMIYEEICHVDASFKNKFKDLETLEKRNNMLFDSFERQVFKEIKAFLFNAQQIDLIDFDKKYKLILGNNEKVMLDLQSIFSFSEEENKKIIELKMEKLNEKLNKGSDKKTITKI